jgi:hypothetical protein
MEMTLFPDSLPSGLIKVSRCYIYKITKIEVKFARHIFSIFKTSIMTNFNKTIKIKIIYSNNIFDNIFEKYWSRIVVFHQQRDLLI